MRHYLMLCTLSSPRVVKLCTPPDADPDVASTRAPAVDVGMYALCTPRGTHGSVRGWLAGGALTNSAEARLVAEDFLDMGVRALARVHLAHKMGFVHTRLSEDTMELSITAALPDALGDDDPIDVTHAATGYDAELVLEGGGGWHEAPADASARAASQFADVLACVRVLRTMAEVCCPLAVPMLTAAHTAVSCGSVGGADVNMSVPRALRAILRPLSHTDADVLRQCACAFTTVTRMSARRTRALAATSACLPPVSLPHDATWTLPALRLAGGASRDAVDAALQATLEERLACLERCDENASTVHMFHALRWGYEVDASVVATAVRSLPRLLALAHFVSHNVCAWWGLSTPPPFVTGSDA